MATVALDRRIGAVGYAAKPRWAVVKIETDANVYVGRLFIPETKKRVSDVLGDERPFLHLVEVCVNGRSQLESFVAINKTYVRTLRIVREDADESEPAGLGPH